MSRWKAVDFDGTLATYNHGDGTALGEPIPTMVKRVKQWLSEGQEVRILTARAYQIPETRPEYTMESWNPDKHIAAIKEWCVKHIGQELKVQAYKDFEMEELWDDRAITVERNTGRRLTGHWGQSIDYPDSAEFYPDEFSPRY